MPVWRFTPWLPDKLEGVDATSGPLRSYELDPTNLGFYLDGESRAYGMARGIGAVRYGAGAIPSEIETRGQHAVKEKVDSSSSES